MTKIAWLSTETQLLIENFDKTTDELFELLGGRRSKKSIARKIEKLREEGKVGGRSKQTLKRAYKQRKRRTKAEMMEERLLKAPKVVSSDYQSVDEDDVYQPLNED